MGWWQAGTSGDEIGDEPADLATAALEAGADALGKPARAQLFRALVAALIEAHDSVDGEPRLQVTAAGVPAESYLGDGGADPQLQARMRALIEEIADVYRDDLDRAPRTSEIGAVLAFILRPRPEHFLSDGHGWKLQHIRPMAAGGGT